MYSRSLQSMARPLTIIRTAHVRDPVEVNATIDSIEGIGWATDLDPAAVHRSLTAAGRICVCGADFIPKS